MNNSQPRMALPHAAAASTQAASAAGAPSRPGLGPTAASVGTSAGCGCAGVNLAAAAAAPPAAALAATAGSAPTIRPASAGAAVGASAWHQNVRITALWSINEERNAWAHLENVGWRKLGAQLHSAHLSMNLLASHARWAGGANAMREESDGMIHEMYVW